METQIFSFFLTLAKSICTILYIFIQIYSKRTER